VEFERIQAMLESCASESPLFPPTLVYNEGWLLRLILDWFSTHKNINHPLAFSENTRWFSEALLPSAFLARHRGDNLAENWTHADGVVGHFLIGDKSKAGLSLLPGATHFVVLEAKISSSLSSNVKSAKYFDQVARNVACIAELFYRANLSPETAHRIGFYVLAPLAQIEKGMFDKFMNREAIQQKVQLRVQEYMGDKDQWYSEWFLPIFQKTNVAIISWEELIETIGKEDAVSSASIETFYKRCIEFN
jgi:hypothetical protein